MHNEKYFPRIVDKELESKLRIFGAAHIVGPKGCGKSRTAEEKSKSAIYFQSMLKSQLNNILTLCPEMLINGDRPRLIDEWQDAPESWDLVRFECDHSAGTGNFILTGSISKKIKTSHTATGRISELKMYPLSLYESQESTGEISLIKLFDNPKCNIGCVSTLSLEKLVFAACRGGWPQALKIKDDRDQLEIAKDYFNQIIKKDMHSIDEVKRNPNTMRAILKSYARNISTLAKKPIF